MRDYVSVVYTCVCIVCVSCVRVVGAKRYATKDVPLHTEMGYLQYDKGHKISIHL